MAAHRRQRLRMLASAPTESSSRASAPVLARPPDRAEPVTSGAGGCRCRRRLSLRGPADDQGHRGGAPLPPDVRPGAHAGHQDTPRGDRHRGPRHRARAIHVRRQPPRLPALPGGGRRARSSPRHHAAAGFGLLTQDRSIRRAVPAGPATRLDRRPRVSVVDGNAEPDRGHPGPAGAQTNPTPGCSSTSSTSPGQDPASTTCASFRRSGSTTPMCATRPARFPPPPRD